MMNRCGILHAEPEKTASPGKIHPEGAWSGKSGITWLYRSSPIHIGAYGENYSEFAYVDCVELAMALSTLNCQRGRFGYRDSILNMNTRIASPLKPN